MGEIKTNDMQEIRNPAVDIFKNITPENGMTISEAQNFWDEHFNGKIMDDAGGAEKPADAPEKVTYVHTIHENLKDDRHPITGVEYKQRIIELPSSEKIEGVFPEFESVFDAKIPEELYCKSDKIQFKECCKQLAEAIEIEPELKGKFTPEQIEQIKDGLVPDGFVWHHDAEPGKLQLVDFSTHALTRHTGGRFLWGGGSDFR